MINQRSNSHGSQLCPTRRFNGGQPNLLHSRLRGTETSSLSSRFSPFVFPLAGSTWIKFLRIMCVVCINHREKKRKRKPNRQQLLGTPAVHSPLTFLSGWRVQAAEKCASWVVRALSKCVGPLHGSSPRHESRTPGGIRDKSEPYIRSTSYTYILLRFV